MPDLSYVRGEIERMRVRISLQRKEVIQLQRAGISTASAELLPALCDEVIAAAQAMKDAAELYSKRRGAVDQW